MGLQFDVNYNVEDFTIVLSTRGYEHYGQIRNIKRDSVTCKHNMNAADELSFEVYKTADGIDERLWDDIKDLKNIDPLNMSPMEALNYLVELKNKMN